ncbi:MAG: hypothetical protein OFPI_08200 [Osedax symbiont Rs2]|nr:MAG: hypothetical protein OFPI_08200 [Osedax symbiont Rs2]
MFRKVVDLVRTANKLPLHIHTATMFTLITVFLGGAQIWFNYQKNTELIAENSTVLYEKVMQNAFMDLKAVHSLASNSLEIMAQGEIAKARTLQARLSYLPVLAKILQANKSVSGFEVGYANGDFFILRAVSSNYLREQFKAPINTTYMIDNIQTQVEGEKHALRIYFDKSLNETGRIPLENLHYDPRTRPWYKLAINAQGLTTTPPYLYYFVKKVGITVTLESKYPGTVIAADISLDDISAILKNNIITPSSELVAFDMQGKVIAYKDPQKLIVQRHNGNSHIARLDELQSPVLSKNALKIEPKEQLLQFEYSEDVWGGAVKKFTVNKDFVLYFAFLAPHHELFSKAIAIRWQSSLIALLLIAIAVCVSAYCAYMISKPLRHLTMNTRRIRKFDFTAQPFPSSSVKEIDTLAKDMAAMKDTIGHFLSMIKTLSGERNLDSLLETITRQTLDISRADATVLYLLNEQETILDPVSVKLASDTSSDIKLTSVEISNGRNFITDSLKQRVTKVYRFKCREASQHKRDVLTPFFEKLNSQNLQVLTLPLNNRSGETTGILCVINDLDNKKTEDLDNEERIGFIETLSGFAAVSMESRHLLKTQKELLSSFIKLIAKAIDAKSHHTAGHCLRVPELTKMLAQAAVEQGSGEFKDFSLSKDQWEELDIASWLHDCGKITTPEYVVDKSTKLETNYDRIHEVRMRFEVLKRDAQINYWKELNRGGDSALLKDELLEQELQLDQDFAFVAECNLGSEYMPHVAQQKILELANLTWQRTIDDRIGISWEEQRRKEKIIKQPLPVNEKLLDDKVEHIIERHPKDVLATNNKWGFNMQTPEYLYNRGEVYNLCIAKGTLNAEERYKINEHIIQTIIMLDELKFPKQLSNVVEIAGGHHEKIDGTGYPKRLRGEEMSTAAKMMVIADIFEALTASDRPYKKAKKLSEAIKIMSYMKKDQHIDASLFELFLSSGIYLTYAHQHLSPEQIDHVDIQQYLQTTAQPTLTLVATKKA